MKRRIYKAHPFCGIDLHTNKMYLCILDETGEIRLHQNIKTDRELFLKVIAPYRESIVVAVEYMFTWHWIADLCISENIPFVLGHALYILEAYSHTGIFPGTRLNRPTLWVIHRWWNQIFIHFSYFSPFPNPSI